MGSNEVAGLIAIAMSLIGFVTVWIKVGHDKGRTEELISTLKEELKESKSNIAEIKTKTHSLELRFTEFMGEIRAKFDFIKEAVSDLKPKGGNRAAKK